LGLVGGGGGEESVLRQRKGGLVVYGVGFRG